MIIWLLALTVSLFCSVLCLCVVIVGGRSERRWKR
jgi:hypothetical protein